MPGETLTPQHLYRDPYITTTKLPIEKSTSSSSLQNWNLYESFRKTSRCSHLARWDEEYIDLIDETSRKPLQDVKEDAKKLLRQLLSSLPSQKCDSKAHHGCHQYISPNFIHTSLRNKRQVRGGILWRDTPHILPLGTHVVLVKITHTSQQESEFQVVQRQRGETQTSRSSSNKSLRPALRRHAHHRSSTKPAHSKTVRFNPDLEHVRRFFQTDSSLAISADPTLISDDSEDRSILSRMTSGPPDEHPRISRSNSLSAFREML
ncbi:hypothetical protein IWW34DRAFT_758798 [Fusarium oxysporum f. sp. albedinis]|nr:hypothetical protein IWW34DRAFT_758798 [Fusarium oxysporum f. sp. albedinis]